MKGIDKENIRNLFRIFFILLSFTSISVGQPQNWSHHTSTQVMSNWTRELKTDDYGNLLMLANSTTLIVYSKSAMDQCDSKLSEIEYGKVPQMILNCSLRKEFWVFFLDSIYIYENGKYTEVKRKQKLPVSNVSVSAAIECADSTIVFSIENGIYQSRNGITWGKITPPATVQESPVPCLMDSRGYIWFRTSQKGLFRFKNGTWENFTKNNTAFTSDNFNIIGTIMVEDKNGTIITGNYDAEGKDCSYYTFNGSTWTSKLISSTNPLSNSIRCMALDSSGAVWFGTNNNVVRLYHDSVYLYAEEDKRLYGAPIAYIRDIAVDKENRVFFGTFHDGVYMLEQNGYVCKGASRIKVIEPEDASSFHSGETMKIQWESFGLIDSVVLEFHSGGQPWTLLNSSTKKYNNIFAYSWRIPELNLGKYYLRVSDFKNSTITDSTRIFNVVDSGQNISPTFVNLPETVFVTKGTISSLEVKTSDNDGDTVKCSISGNPDWVSMQGNKITFSPVLNSQNCKLQLIITDGRGGLDTGYIQVAIEPPVKEKNMYVKEYSSFLPIQVNGQIVRIPADNIRYFELYNLNGEKITPRYYNYNSSSAPQKMIKCTSPGICLLKAQYSHKVVITKINGVR